MKQNLTINIRTGQWVMISGRRAYTVESLEHKGYFYPIVLTIRRACYRLLRVTDMSTAF